MGGHRRSPESLPLYHANAAALYPQSLPCRSYCAHLRAHPPRTIAQFTCTLPAQHQAAVRSPLPEPSERQRSGSAFTSTCPSLELPMGFPSSFTSASLAAGPAAAGQGCPRLHSPPISRAAMPARRIFGPSAHQMGPSPSQTRVGVQEKLAPAATIEAAKTVSIAFPDSLTCAACPCSWRSPLGERM